AGKQAVAGRSVFIIDWNGEYAGTIAYFYGTEYKINNRDEIKKLIDEVGVPLHQAGLSSVNLSGMRNGAERRLAARDILSTIAGELGEAPSWRGVQKTLILDEAWKVLEGNELSTLFREGRKYGMGIVIASQTASDLSEDIISNCATAVMFRLQSAGD
ncbi:AAA ATPase, partial [mine drainage metagenome]